VHSRTPGWQRLWFWFLIQTFVFFCISKRLFLVKVNWCIWQVDPSNGLIVDWVTVFSVEAKSDEMQMYDESFLFTTTTMWSKATVQRSTEVLANICPHYWVKSIDYVFRLCVAVPCISGQSAWSILLIALAVIVDNEVGEHVSPMIQPWRLYCLKLESLFLLILRDCKYKL